MMMVCIADANAAMGRGVSFSFVTTAEALDAEPEDCRIEGPVEITGEILCTGEAYRLTGCVRCKRNAVCDRFTMFVGRIVSGFARNVVPTSMRVSAAVTVPCPIRGLRLWSSF